MEGMGLLTVACTPERSAGSQTPLAEVKGARLWALVFAPCRSKPGPRPKSSGGWVATEPSIWERKQRMVRSPSWPLVRSLMMARPGTFRTPMRGGRLYLPVGWLLAGPRLAGRYYRRRVLQHRRAL